MKIYLAGSYVNRLKIRKWMAALRKLFGGIPGEEIIITEDWTYHEEASENKETSYAYADFNGVKECDIFILDAESKSSGKMIELGMALAWNKQIYVIGELTAIFHYMIPQGCYYPTFEDLLEVL